MKTFFLRQTFEAIKVLYRSRTQTSKLLQHIIIEPNAIYSKTIFSLKRVETGLGSS